MIIITPRMVRDILAFKGPLSLTELSSKLAADKNIIQTFLLDLASAGEVSYNLETGAWESEVVL